MWFRKNTVEAAKANNVTGWVRNSAEDTNLVVGHVSVYDNDYNTYDMNNVVTRRIVCVPFQKWGAFIFVSCVGKATSDPLFTEARMIRAFSDLNFWRFPHRQLKSRGAAFAHCVGRPFEDS